MYCHFTGRTWIATCTRWRLRRLPTKWKVYKNQLHLPFFRADHLELIAMDISDFFSEMTTENRFFVVIINRFSKLSRNIQTKTITTQQISTILMDQWEKHLPDFTNSTNSQRSKICQWISQFRLPQSRLGTADDHSLLHPEKLAKKRILQHDRYMSSSLHMQAPGSLGCVCTAFDVRLQLRFSLLSNHDFFQHSSDDKTTPFSRYIYCIAIPSKCKQKHSGADSAETNLTLKNLQCC